MPWRIWLGIWILYRIANRSSCFININFILNSFLGENRNPIVNTNYNPWSAWTPCPQTCQAANQSVVQVRNRTCFTSPQGCFATIETRPCGVPICPGLCECFNYGQEHNRPFPSNLVPLFQTGLRARPFVQTWVWFEGILPVGENHEWFRMKIRFATEAKSTRKWPVKVAEHSF